VSTFGEPFCGHRGQHLVSYAELHTRVHAAVLAAQPLAVEQVRAAREPRP
jgi:hypothetical protein